MKKTKIDKNKSTKNADSSSDYLLNKFKILTMIAIISLCFSIEELSKNGIIYWTTVKRLPAKSLTHILRTQIFSQLLNLSTKTTNPISKGEGIKLKILILVEDRQPFVESWKEERIKRVTKNYKLFIFKGSQKAGKKEFSRAKKA